MQVATNIKTIKNEETWELEISAEIPTDALASYRDEALKEMTKSAHIDGFRPGKAPKEMIEKRVGESAILEEAASLAIRHDLAHILADSKENIVDTPRVSVEPIFAGTPVKFSAKAPLAPKVDLPDYKKIAKEINAKKEEQNVTDEEHAQALGHLKRERARIEAMESGKNPQEAAEHMKALKDEELPAIDDEFAISLGYDSAKAFEEAVRTNIKTEKELKEAEKRRAELLETLNDKTTIKFPRLLSDFELQDMASRLEDDLQRAGVTMEKFLADSKKTAEDLLKEWRPAADKRARIRLILANIALAEKIEANKEQLEHEMEHAKEHYKDADDAAIRAHIEHAMRNEAVIRFLEEQ